MPSKCKNFWCMVIGMSIGSCCIGSVDRSRLKELFAIPDRFHINLVVALGYPAEDSVVEEMKNTTIPAEIWARQASE